MRAFGPSDEELRRADFIILVDSKRPEWKDVLYRQHDPEVKERPIVIEINSRNRHVIEEWQARVLRLKYDR